MLDRICRGGQWPSVQRNASNSHWFTANTNNVLPDEQCSPLQCQAKIVKQTWIEYGATSGKFDLAACAKKNGLDAIHDTVHEMARDEARHGKAFEGLLNRYFKA